MTKFKSGHAISQNILDALIFTGKIGIMSFKIWETHFAMGNYRWRKKQFAKLVEQKFFEKHRNHYAQRIFILGEQGKFILNKMNQTIVLPPYVGLMEHDLFIGTSMILLEKAGLTNSWLSDRELRKQQDLLSPFQRRESDKKYPDAAFKILINGSLRTVALEYEKERKSISRYRSILWNYAMMNSYSMVLYVLERPSIRLVLNKCLKDLDLFDLKNRLAFVDAKEWMRDPARASITLGEDVFQLINFCELNSKMSSA